MSNAHPQPRQFVPNRHSSNPNNKQRSSMNPARETNFVPRTYEGGFNPSRIQKNRASSNYPNNQNNNFYYNYNSNNNTNDTSNNTNNNSSNNSSSTINNNNSINTSNSNNYNTNNNNTMNNKNDNNKNYNNANANTNNANNDVNDNSSVSNNDNNNENSHIAPLHCPLCTENKFTFYSECIFHIIMYHNYQSLLKKSVSDRKCIYCGELLLDDNEAIVQHMYDYHREKFFESINESTPRKKATKMKSYLKQVLHVKEEPRVILKKIDEKQIENYNEKDDDDYVNFIASSIHLDGLSSINHVKIQNVQPITNPNPQPQTEVIDHNFWVKLNNIAESLSNSGKIELSENRYFCYLCKKDFDSHVKLLSHCWNEHQNTK